MLLAATYGLSRCFKGIARAFILTWTPYTCRFGMRSGMANMPERALTRSKAHTLQSTSNAPCNYGLDCMQNLCKDLCASTDSVWWNLSFLIPQGIEMFVVQKLTIAPGSGYR